jgi:hypothetical protein
VPLCALIIGPPLGSTLVGFYLSVPVLKTFINFADITFIMIKKLLLCLMCTTILSSCKKSESAPPVDTEDHVDQTRLNFLKKLEGGSGKWLITKDVTVMYDKNNTVAYVRTNNKPDVYYNFYHLGPIHDFKDLEIAVYPNKVPALLDNSFGFDLTYEGNTFYCTTKYDNAI